MIKFINNGKSNNVLSAKLNVFLQEEEPEIKEGVWLQSANLTHDDIIIGNEMVIYEEVDEFNSVADIPYDFYEGCAVAIGTDVFLIGGYKSLTNMYKYDTLNNTYTKLSDIPFSFYNGKAVAIDTDIYMFGSSYSNCGNKAYKYDTLTDTYEQLADIPYIFKNCEIAVIEKTIYLLNSYYAQFDSNKGLIYTYDISTNKYNLLVEKLITEKEPFNYISSPSGAVAIGTDIYFAESGGLYKYDTISGIGTYIKVDSGTIASHEYGTFIVVGDTIYAIGDYPSNANLIHKYNIKTNQGNEVCDVGYELQWSAVVRVNNKIYIFGSGDDKSVYRKATFLNLTLDTYPNNSIIISQGHGGYPTQLFSYLDVNGRLLWEFYDAWHYTTANGFNKKIPTYYGDGEKWIKFKN